MARKRTRKLLPHHLQLLVRAHQFCRRDARALRGAQTRSVTQVHARVRLGTSNKVNIINHINMPSHHVSQSRICMPRRARRTRSTAAAARSVWSRSALAPASAIASARPSAPECASYNARSHGALRPGGGRTAGRNGQPLHTRPNAAGPRARDAVEHTRATRGPHGTIVGGHRARHFRPRSRRAGYAHPCVQPRQHPPPHPRSWSNTPREDRNRDHRAGRRPLRFRRERDGRRSRAPLATSARENLCHRAACSGPPRGTECATRAHLGRARRRSHSRKSRWRAATAHKRRGGVIHAERRRKTPPRLTHRQYAGPSVRAHARSTARRSMPSSPGTAESQHPSAPPPDTHTGTRTHARTHTHAHTHTHTRTHTYTHTHARTHTHAHKSKQTPSHHASAHCSPHPLHRFHRGPAAISLPPQTRPQPASRVMLPQVMRLRQPSPQPRAGVWETKKGATPPWSRPPRSPGGHQRGYGGAARGICLRVGGEGGAAMTRHDKQRRAWAGTCERCRDRLRARRLVQDGLDHLPQA